MFLVLLCMIHQCWSFKENLCILSSKFKNFLHLWRNFPQPPDFILVCNFSSCSRVPFFSFYHFKQKCHITEVKWSDVTYGQVWWPILGICALHLTHPKCAHTQQWTHTHTVNTHPEQWAAIAAAPREQLGVRCLAQEHLSRGIEGGESAGYSLPSPTIPARPETRTRNLWVTSPTL